MYQLEFIASASDSSQSLGFWHVCACTLRWPEAVYMEDYWPVLSFSSSQKRTMISSEHDSWNMTMYLGVKPLCHDESMRRVIWEVYEEVLTHKQSSKIQTTTDASASSLALSRNATKVVYLEVRCESFKSRNFVVTTHEMIRKRPYQISFMLGSADRNEERARFWKSHLPHVSSEFSLAMQEKSTLSSATSEDGRQKFETMVWPGKQNPKGLLCLTSLQPKPVPCWFMKTGLGIRFQPTVLLHCDGCRKKVKMHGSGITRHLRRNWR